LVAGLTANFQNWIDQARAGDESARNQLFGACRSFVGLCARAQLDQHLKAKVDASDLVQQSLLDAHQGFDRFAGATPGEWLAWLHQVVNRNAQDVVRKFVVAEKRAVGREVSIDRPQGDRSTAFEPAAVCDSPSEIAIAWERHLELAAAIDALPEDYREVVYLRNVLQVPFEEIAARLGRSRGAVQMLWMRAIERLRDAIGSGSGLE
jgi:RNA polymerase sigma-70 factor (ECF subfamily)